MLELERLYSLVIDVEDCEKKLMALPTNTPMSAQVEAEKIHALRRMRLNLAVEQRLRKFILVRKGKALLARAMRLLDEESMSLVCLTLFSLYPLAVRKDRDDHLLPDLWICGVARHLGHQASLEQLCHYLKLLVSPSSWGSHPNASRDARGASKSPPNAAAAGASVLRVALATPMGLSVIYGCLYKICSLLSNENANLGNRASGSPHALGDSVRSLLLDMGKELADKDLLSCEHPLPLDLLLAAGEDLDEDLVAAQVIKPPISLPNDYPGRGNLLKFLGLIAVTQQ